MYPPPHCVTQSLLSHVHATDKGFLLLSKDRDTEDEREGETETETHRMRERERGIENTLTCWQKEHKILREEEEKEEEEEEEEEEAAAAWTRAYENTPNHRSRHSIRPKHCKMRKMWKMCSKVSVPHTCYTKCIV